MEEPDRKRRRIDALDPDATPLQNDIPPSVQEDMDESWKNLNAGRKAMLKAAAAEAPTPEDLATYQDVDQKAWHKSSCKGVPLMSKSGSLIVTAGKDKQIVVYHEVEQVVKETFNFGSVATCVDIASNLVVAGDSKGKITAYALTDDGSGDGMSATAKTDAGSIVDVRVHPSQNQVVASSANGTVMIFIAALEEKRLQLVTTFVKGDDNGQTEFTCGALHPDGLLYVAGTKDGALWTWDFRSKNLAAILKVRIFSKN
jgi:WD40 repeat protein